MTTENVVNYITTQSWFLTIKGDLILISTLDVRNQISSIKKSNRDEMTTRLMRCKHVLLRAFHLGKIGKGTDSKSKNANLGHTLDCCSRKPGGTCLICFWDFNCPRAKCQNCGKCTRNLEVSKELYGWPSLPHLYIWCVVKAWISLYITHHVSFAPTLDYETMSSRVQVHWEQERNIDVIRKLWLE